MMIHVAPFGQAGNEKCMLYTLTSSSGASVQITDYSGAIVSVNVPDKHGKIENVAPGFPSVKDYRHNAGFLGALIGPVGNRISGAEFDFCGKTYKFTPNEFNKNLLHSGDFGFHSKLWKAYAVADESVARLVLEAEFNECDTGFPGNLKAKVVYSFNESSELRIDYEIASDAPSFASPTNHVYFNIAGTGTKRLPLVDRQHIQIFADHYTKVDAESIPLSTEKVDGTPFDLREPLKLKDGFEHITENEQMQIGCGYDHNFVLSEPIDPETGLRLAAKVSDARSGREMRVYTDMPCVQLYTANHLNRYNAVEHRYYKPRQALCLETQCAPDSIHRKGEFGFDVMEITPEKPLRSSTVYAFGLVK